MRKVRVVFDNYTFVGLRLSEINTKLTALIWRTDEIIWNIHQNPELLND